MERLRQFSPDPFEYPTGSPSCVLPVGSASEKCIRATRFGLRSSRRVCFLPRAGSRASAIVPYAALLNQRPGVLLVPPSKRQSNSTDDGPSLADFGRTLQYGGRVRANLGGVLANTLPKSTLTRPSQAKLGRQSAKISPKLVGRNWRKPGRCRSELTGGGRSRSRVGRSQPKSGQSLSIPSPCWPRLAESGPNAVETRSAKLEQARAKFGRSKAKFGPSRPPKLGRFDRSRPDAGQIVRPRFPERLWILSRPRGLRSCGLWQCLWRRRPHGLQSNGRRRRGNPTSGGDPMGCGDGGRWRSHGRSLEALEARGNTRQPLGSPP